MVKGHQETFEGEGQVCHDCDNCGTGISKSQDLSTCTFSICAVHCMIITPQSSYFIKVLV